MKTQTDLAESALDTLWRPFTQHGLKQKPMVMVEGRGCTVVDSDGKEYIDAMAGLWCLNVGYGQTKLVEAATKQLMTLPYTAPTRPAQSSLELSLALTRLLPGDLNHVAFLSSGSEAVEAALKIARQYAHQKYPKDNRFKVIARYRGYHGWTMGALGATGQAARKTRFEPALSGFVHIRPPDSFHLYAGVAPKEAAQMMAKELEEVIEFEGPDTIAAFIGEPIIGGGGLIVPPDDYWPLIRQICTKYGILLIQDEVITGFGRTGKWFGCMNWGVVPDLMSMAKGLSSGYIPLAATAATDEVFDAFKGEASDNVQFSQLSTYGGHPVACAVGVANLALMEELNLVERSAQMGKLLLAGLKGLEKKHAIVGEARGRGLLCGVELVKPGTNDPLEIPLVNKVMAEAQKRGVIFGRNVATTPRLECVITLSPPLVITEAEVNKVVSVLDEALGTVKA